MADLPDYGHFIVPLLKALGASPNGLSRRTAFETVAANEGLTREQQELTLPSGEPTYRNRIGWAHDALKRFGFSISPRRGQWQLTPAGLSSIKSHDGLEAVDAVLELNRGVRRTYLREKDQHSESPAEIVESRLKPSPRRRGWF